MIIYVINLIGLCEKQANEAIKCKHLLLLSSVANQDQNHEIDRQLSFCSLNNSKNLGCSYPFSSIYRSLDQTVQIRCVFDDI